jgi:glucokinase
MKQNTGLNLVADIGGTNARFALVEDKSHELIKASNLVCADYPTITDAILDYLERTALGFPVTAAISVASSVTSDQIVMTNNSWNFSISETRQALNCASLKVLNDYTALALALPFIGEAQCIKIGGGSQCEDFSKAVIGPGTGLGVSAVVPVADFWMPLEGEGGHVTYGAVTPREAKIIHILGRTRKHISAELLVSGGGISSIYAALTEIDKGRFLTLKPSEITHLALAGQDALAIETLSIFCEILGTVAGNLALTLGARGGVYLGGGILPKVTDFLVASNFRQRFEDHGRFTSYLQKIPTYLINTEYPALLGAMVSLQKEYASVGVVSNASSNENLSDHCKNNQVGKTKEGNRVEN